jgi:carboxylesterase type B
MGERFRLVSVLCVLVAAASAVTATPALGSARHGERGLVVTTDNGRVRGENVDGVQAFRGMPYAAAPVGALRFAPPAPARRWRGTLDATGLTPPCPQLPSSNGPQTLDEDCLKLDVWRPRGGSRAERPVLVFIHGGGNTNGSGGQQHPFKMVRQTGTIVVTFNYRLSILGWLALPAMDAAYRGDSGNIGVLDQQAALRWVQANIERFGGDPTNVTLGGESAGGWGVCANLVSPGSAGLFDRAVIESITCTFRERQAALAQGEAIARSLGCTDPATVVACLRGKDTLALLQAWRGDARPVVGGSAVPQAPMTAIDAGDYNRVPVIWGNTYDEFSFVMLGNPDMTPAELRAAVAARYPTHVDAILAEYAGARSPTWAYSAHVSDPFICGQNDQAGRLSRSTLVWYFEWNDQDPPPEVGITLNIGAYHSGELQYLYGFSTRTDGTPKQSRGLDAAERRLSTEMIGYWGAFAAKGNPNHRGALEWPRFDLRRPFIMRFAPDATAVVAGSRFDADHHCAFWRSLGVPLEIFF